MRPCTWVKVLVSVARLRVRDGVAGQEPVGTCRDHCADHHHHNPPPPGHCTNSVDREAFEPLRPRPGVYGPLGSRDDNFACPILVCTGVGFADRVLCPCTVTAKVQYWGGKRVDQAVSWGAGIWGKPGPCSQRGC